MTIQKANQTIKELHKFYRSYVKDRVKKAGGYAALSRETGIKYVTIRKVVDRDKFGPLMKLAQSL